nr:Cyclin F-box domain containing protein [Haemonchus contortus]
MKTSRARLFWREARNKLLDCQQKMGVVRKKSPVSSSIVLDEPVLEEVLKRLDLNERVQLRSLSSQVSDLVDRMPLVLPFVFIRSDGCGDIELHCDRMDILQSYVLTDQSAFEVRNGAIVFSYGNTSAVITAIVSRITGIAHLWLDSEWNGHIVQAIVEYYQSINNGSRRMRLHMEQLTVVGSIRSSDIDWFWSAISQCQQLAGLQYEPCRLDKWSRPHLIDALDNKSLKSLILTGIDGLKPADLIRIAADSQLTELAVVGELIKPSIYAQKEALKMLDTVENLLIQVDSTFSIDDPLERGAILQMMMTLPANSTLEVIHVSRGTVSDTTKLISYWIRLARDSSRAVKLKLEECSQERADAAVGRLLRKTRDVTRTVWTNAPGSSSGNEKQLYSHLGISSSVIFGELTRN